MRKYVPHNTHVYGLRELGLQRLPLPQLLLIPAPALVTNLPVVLVQRAA